MKKIKDVSYYVDNFQMKRIETTLKEQIELNNIVIINANRRYKKNKSIVSMLLLRNQRYEHILNFIRLIRRGNIDKRFLDIMFSDDLTPYVDTSKLTKEICDLIAQSRKLFPKRRSPKSVFPYDYINRR